MATIAGCNEHVHEYDSATAFDIVHRFEHVRVMGEDALLLIPDGIYLTCACGKIKHFPAEGKK